MERMAIVLFSYLLFVTGSQARGSPSRNLLQVRSGSSMSSQSAIVHVRSLRNRSRGLVGCHQGLYLLVWPQRVVFILMSSQPSLLWTPCTYSRAQWRCRQHTGTIRATAPSQRAAAPQATLPLTGEAASKPPITLSTRGNGRQPALLPTAAPFSTWTQPTSAL
jgi:hypothetical protein